MNPIQRIVLVGFMGAGKSTVAAYLAPRLGWRYVDLDREIERVAGTCVSEIFRHRGEVHFRLLEREATRRLAGCTGIVLASGGGWMIQPGIVNELGAGTLSVWLRVSARIALERLGPGESGRPLLTGPDPLGRMERLLAQREPAYARADHVVETDGLVLGEVVDQVERVVRSRGL